MTVLVAEDDAITRRGLTELLEDEGFDVLAAADGARALTAFHSGKPDVVCLDVMMPELDGYEVCRRIRRHDRRVPILFISARGEEIDKVVGLELGADDFIVKPFGVKEVVARIRALLRRTAPSDGEPLAEGPTDEPFVIGDLRVVPPELRAYRGPTAIALSQRDVLLLYALFRHGGHVMSRNDLFVAGWAVDNMPNTRSLDQHISQLRRKIERDPKNPRIIRTVHGVGYRYDP